MEKKAQQLMELSRAQRATQKEAIGHLAVGDIRLALGTQTQVHEMGLQIHRLRLELFRERSHHSLQHTRNDDHETLLTVATAAA